MSSTQEVNTMSVPATQPSWMPTRKWQAAFVTLVSAVFIAWLTTGDFNGEEIAILSASAPALLAAYVKKNDALLPDEQVVDLGVGPKPESAVTPDALA